MKGGLFLYRWFRDVSITRKLYFTVGIMAVLIGVELFVLFFSLSTLSSLRAYVGGEGLWSKAQKDAVFHLYRYGISRNEEDYDLFEQFMRVPIGDSKGRQVLLLKKHRDVNLAREGFLEGRNNPADIDGMISLFTRFDNVFYIRKAIVIWGEGEAVAMQLMPLAQKLRDEIHSPHPSQDKIRGLLVSIDVTNQKLTAFEDEFSYTLGEGSRWLEKLVLRLLFTTALTVEATGLLLVISVSRRIQKGLAEIIRAAKSVSTGELYSRARVLSRDEIGVVANSFNEMAGTLQVRMKQLAELNQHLGHEIAERKRTEEVLRETNETLERRVTERATTLTHLTDALRNEAADRERAEAALRQSQKMDAIGQLTGGIAHDFNNMLAAVSGNLEMISRRTAEGRTADLERYIEAALTSTARAATLSHRLLAFSRHQTPDPKVTDINRVVLGMEELFRNTVGPAIHVDTRLASDLHPVLCDPNQLENALLNLIINARDAMPDGGSLVIETTNSVVADREGAPNSGIDLSPGDYATLIITDTGVGMTPETLAHAFDPFFTTKPSGQGTGLGLSMVYGFVEQSGGKVFLRTAEGQGTTVTLHLPRVFRAVQQPPEPEMVATYDSPEAPENAVVLVVEDEPDLRMVVVDLLEDIGYTVLVAEDGATGLAIVDSQARIDLLVSDVGLPGNISGRQLADSALQRRSDLSVLFITGYAEGATAGSDLLDEGRQVMTKPFSLTAFASTVHGIISRPIPRPSNQNRPP
jgi:signal transduction histidine kinase/CheY-like chemotaxis protein